MQTRARSFVVLFGTLSVAAALAIAACGDSSSGGSPADADAALDAPGTKTDSATTETGPSDAAVGQDVNVATDTGTGDTGTDAMDAGTDADAMTNNSVWLADSGTLPSTGCAMWTLVDTATAHDPVITDAGVMLLATDSNAQNMYWIQNAADLITPATIVLEARMQMIAGSSSNTTRAPAGIVIRYGTPTKTAAFFVSTTETFLNSADLTRGQTATVATTDALHTYRLTINTATHAVTVARDGTDILTGTAYTDPDNSVTTSIYWGEASNLATGSNVWASVTHNAHAPSTCP